MSSFDPKVLVFCCKWCSYAGADLAGISRIQYSPNVRIIRVMCSGRVEPQFILRAFELGADGIMVTGCHPGECHYVNGNEKAKERVEMTSNLIETLGIDSRRLKLKWFSASEGQQFADTVNGFVEEIRSLGGKGKCLTSKT